MKTIVINEFLIINTYTGKRRWLSKPPGRPKTSEIIINIKGRIKYPEPIFTADFGEITIDEAEVFAQAQMK